LKKLLILIFHDHSACQAKSTYIDTFLHIKEVLHVTILIDSVRLDCRL
jgi:hypothetical protein